jgi:hypothetical protein
MNLAMAIIGLPLLLAGRRIYWFFVGAIGFLIGVTIATQFFSESSETTRILIAVGAGILGGIFALALQRAAIVIAGFLAGWYLMIPVMSRVSLGDWTWIGYVMGGIAGAVLIAILFDWTLITLSTLLGALLMVRGLAIDSSYSTLVYILLMLGGIVVQSVDLSKEKYRPEKIK